MCLTLCCEYFHSFRSHWYASVLFMQLDWVQQSRTCGCFFFWYSFCVRQSGCWRCIWQLKDLLGALIDIIFAFVYNVRLAIDKVEIAIAILQVWWVCKNISWNGIYVLLALLTWRNPLYETNIEVMFWPVLTKTTLCSKIYFQFSFWIFLFIQKIP